MEKTKAVLRSFIQLMSTTVAILRKQPKLLVKAVLWGLFGPGFVAVIIAVMYLITHDVNPPPALYWIIYIPISVLLMLSIFVKNEMQQGKDSTSKH